MSGVWAVVPVKCFSRGKSRLRDVLSRADREELARSLCDRALSVLAECDAVDGALVATDCAHVARFAESRDAIVLRDLPAASFAQIIDRALAALSADGASAALVLMADLPFLTADDVRALVAALERAPLVLAPDRHGRGTNALAVSPPERIATCFGSETSFALHVARARESRLDVAVHRSEGVGFDLDSPADLDVARAYADRGAFLSWNRKRPSRVRAA